MKVTHLFRRHANVVNEAVDILQRVVCLSGYICSMYVLSAAVEAAAHSVSTNGSYVFLA